MRQSQVAEASLQPFRHSLPLCNSLLMRDLMNTHWFSAALTWRVLSSGSSTDAVAGRGGAPT
jgi:hypothetical protein